MARKCKRPIILPLSSPTSKSEAVPEDLLQWTEGRALIATGSPFPNVNYKGQEIRIAQCNNVYIFPAMGLAISATRPKRVTDSMFLAAAHALAQHSPRNRIPRRLCCPSSPDCAAPPSKLPLPPLSRLSVKDWRRRHRLKLSAKPLRPLNGRRIIPSMLEPTQRRQSAAL
jgi:malic enzyme